MTGFLSRTQYMVDIQYTAGLATTKETTHTVQPPSAEWQDGREQECGQLEGKVTEQNYRITVLLSKAYDKPCMTRGLAGPRGAMEELSQWPGDERSVP